MARSAFACRDHLLFPTLKPADVAEKILDGIIHRRRRVYVPPRIRLVHPLKLYAQSSNTFTIID